MSGVLCCNHAFAHRQNTFSVLCSWQTVSCSCWPTPWAVAQSGTRHVYLCRYCRAAGKLQSTEPAGSTVGLTPHEQATFKGAIQQHCKTTLPPLSVAADKTEIPQRSWTAFETLALIAVETALSKQVGVTVISLCVQAWAQLAGISSTAAYSSGKIWRQLWGPDAGLLLGEQICPLKALL